MSASYLTGRTPPLPYALRLPNGQTLELQQWLRVLPDQRYVAQAQWQGQTVLAKLFVGPKAQRHHARELAGVQALITQNIQTPVQLGAEADTSLCWVLFEFLPDAASLGQRWLQVAGGASNVDLKAKQYAVLTQALGCIAHMHKKGIWQSDLHLDNFLQQGEQLYVIDGGGVEHQVLGQPISAEHALDNLAVFFAQLPPETDQYHEQLLGYLPARKQHACAVF